VIADTTLESLSAPVKSMFKIELIDDSNQLELLRAEWNELLSASEANSIFLTWESLCSWWECFGSGHRLLLLKCSDGEGRLVALAPMFHTKANAGLGFSLWQLRLLGDFISGAEKLDWIVRKGYEGRVVPLLMDWLERKAPPWQILHYNTVRCESAAAKVFLEECKKRRWYVLREQRQSCCVLLPDSLDAYLSMLSKKMRLSLSQRARRTSKAFVTKVRQSETLEELPADLQVLFALHAQRWQTRGMPGGLYQPQKQKFYFEVARRCLERNWLEFWFLELDGKPVACEFGFGYDGIYSFLHGGFDPEYSSYGVAAALRVAIVQDLIRRGFRGYDFLLGEEPYKEQWCADKKPLLYLSIARPGSLGKGILLVAILSRQGKEWLRSVLPAPLASLARRVFRFFTLGKSRNSPPPPLKPS
jgi:CelD/BcsL family acetyltransferase involved in cellulose biosynthesis